jgi:hypothetical protein
MKKLISVFSLCLIVGLTSANAQSKVDKAGEEVKEAGKKVGHKTAEVASKGKSKVTDQTYKDKVGPNNETIYIDRHNKYYWVDDKGHRHYVTEAELKNKED